MESMTLQEHEAHNVMLLPVHRPATITQHRAISALCECLASFIMSEPGACPECGGRRAHAGLCRIRWPKMDQEHVK